MKRVIALFLVCCGVVVGQSITVTASRTIYGQPDQVLFEVDVNSGLDASLDTVVAALAGSGITGSNLSSVYAQTPDLGSRAGIFQPLRLDWTFTLSAPLSKLKDTIASLTALQQTIAQKNAGLSMTFGVTGTQASPQQCSTPDLIADARAQAQKLANAAGVNVGPILAVSELASTATPTSAVRLGDFSAFDFSAFFINTQVFAIAPGPPSNCSLTVKFGMFR
jgi:hypothetical protein